ncbi:MAG: sodium:alanine symporter family protein [Candidatus Aminicenantales bacterium]
MFAAVLNSLLDFFVRVERILWGPWTILFIAGVSVYLTVRSRFFQFRHFRMIVRATFGRIFEKINLQKGGRMTPFQAVSTALAGTVGMGNIAGVATALSVGGPGAIFWMWVFALLSMMSKTAEITLAVHYREVDDQGNLHGGRMYTIRKGLGWNPLAVAFILGIFINSLLTASLLQAHTVGRAFLSTFQLSPYITTAGMAAVTGIVVIGGIRRIGRLSAKLVPFMAVLYVLIGLVILVVKANEIPGVLQAILKLALAPAPAVGGFIGASVASAVKNGMNRGMLSNEAGLGTAPMAHATAETPHPFQQGLWGIFEVFVDTIVICSITALAIMTTGALASGRSGIELVIEAFSGVFPGQTASLLISVCILTFCLTTQIGFFIYYETAVVDIFGRKMMPYLKWLYLVPGVIFAGFSNVDRLWVLASVSVGVCAIPNLIAVLALSGAFFRLLRDFLEGRNEYATRTVDRTREYVRSPRKRKT